MPRVSKAEAVVALESEVLTSRQAELDSFTVVFEEYHVDADGAPLFRGLPDDRCQCPHWGVVVSGQLTVRYRGGEETFRAGRAYVIRPCHVPAVIAGTELIEFIPTDTHLLRPQLDAYWDAAAALAHLVGEAAEVVDAVPVGERRRRGLRPRRGWQY